MEWSNAWWIGLSRNQIREQKIFAGEDNGHFACFRLTTEINEPADLKLLITANSRYRFWINEVPILSGPCKGDEYRHYYEEVDVSAYLKTGKNVFVVQVLYCDPNQSDDMNNMNTSIAGVVSKTVGHRLCAEGNLMSKDGRIIGTVTTGAADWKVYYEPEFFLKSKNVNTYLGAITEEIDFNKVLQDWKKVGFDDSRWWIPEKKHLAKDSEFEKSVGFLPKLRLMPRPIPLLMEKRGRLDVELGSCYFQRNNEITIPENTGLKMIFHARELMSGYLQYHFSGGKNAKVIFTYFEKFVDETGDEVPYTNWQEGHIYSGGQTDEIILSGKSICYEPFWMRTYRFVQIEIENKDECLVMHRPEYLQTRYPMEPQTVLKSSVPWVEQLFDICTRTLQNCMMETYMDCPFYEQMQFIMDTRLQMRFQTAVSTDMRLARKALEDFHCSMEPYGLIHGKYPCAFPQIISTFSLYYVYALYEYYEQTGDLDVVRLYQNDCDRILEYYDSKIDDTGLVGHIGYWPFVDWKDEWGAAGVPNDGLKTPSAIINLMYTYALECAAKLFEAVHRPGMAQEYRSRIVQIHDRIEELCWNADREMYTDGPGWETFSQHTQSWAVVSGLLQGEKAKTAMKHALYDEDVVTCTFSASYELFRALEITGLYEETRDLLDGWIRLLDKKCTTCPEVPVGGRSACHGWSALPMYEFVRCLAGIRPAEPGWEKVRIQPHMSYLPDLSGHVITPKGTIAFEYHVVDGRVKGKIRIPSGMEVEYAGIEVW